MAKEKNVISPQAWQKIFDKVEAKVFIQLNGDSSLDDDQRSQLANLKARKWMRETFVLESGIDELERLKAEFGEEA